MAEFRTYDLSIGFVRFCRTVTAPADLRDQLYRASTSISLNLKEGSARHTSKDRHRFYRMALSSMRECEAILDILEVKENQAETLARHLNKLCKSTELKS